jgi:DNA-directed RNA polymerase subunit RPC12/RpoP
VRTGDIPLLFLDILRIGEEGMKNYTEPTRKDYTQSIVYIILYIFAIFIGAYFLLPKYWYLWVLVVVVGLIILVFWHKEKTVYSCPNCGHVYEISFLTDLLAPHGIGREGAWLLLRCPHCHERHKTKVLKRVD